MCFLLWRFQLAKQARQEKSEGSFLWDPLNLTWVLSRGLISRQTPTASASNCWAGHREKRKGIPLPVQKSDSQGCHPSFQRWRKEKIDIFPSVDSRFFSYDCIGHMFWSADFKGWEKSVCMCAHKLQELHIQAYIFLFFNLHTQRDYALNSFWC